MDHHEAISREFLDEDDENESEVESESGDISVNLDEKVIDINMDLQVDDEDEAYYEVHEKIEEFMMEKRIKVDYNISKNKKYGVRFKIIG